MAIKVQVKGDKKFDQTYADSSYCNGTFVNEAFGPFAQPVVSPVDAINFNSSYTTPMLDGTCGMPFIGSQVPASLASLYGTSFMQPNFAGTKPFIGSTYGQNASVTPFNTTVSPITGQYTGSSLNSFGVNPYAATTVNAFGQVIPAINTGLYGTGIANQSPFQGWTVPAMTEQFGQAKFNGFKPAFADYATQGMIQNPALASLYGTPDAWSTITPSTLGASSLYPFGMQSQLNSASILPWMKANESWTGINPLAWQNTMSSPWAPIASKYNAIDLNGSLASSSALTSPWTNGISTVAPAMSTFAQQAMMSATLPVDVYENEDEYILLADLPGASIEDIDLLIEGQSLIIKGIVKPLSWEKMGMGINAVTLLQEKPAMKNIYRVFTIGSNVMTDKLAAKLTDGILTVKLPKMKVGFGTTHRVAVATA